MKYKSQIIGGACLTALALSIMPSAFARSKATPAPSATAAPAASAAATAKASPAAKADRAIPFRGMISAVDEKAKTFTIAGKEKSRVFKITDKSVLMKAGNPATMKDVTANEEVRGSYWKAADGSLEAKSVKLGPMTESEKAAAAKKSTKKHKTGAAPADAGSPAASPAASASPKP